MVRGHGRQFELIMTPEMLNRMEFLVRRVVDRWESSLLWKAWYWLRGFRSYEIKEMKHFLTEVSAMKMELIQRQQPRTLRTVPTSLSTPPGEVLH